jgi:hypothetical protein
VLLERACVFGAADFDGPVARVVRDDRAQPVKGQLVSLSDDRAIHVGEVCGRDKVCACVIHEVA